MVFNVNNIVQGQQPITRSTTDSTKPILLPLNRHSTQN